MSNCSPARREREEHRAPGRDVLDGVASSSDRPDRSVGLDVVKRAPPLDMFKPRDRSEIKAEVASRHALAAVVDQQDRPLRARWWRGEGGEGGWGRPSESSAD